MGPHVHMAHYRCLSGFQKLPALGEALSAAETTERERLGRGDVGEMPHLDSWEGREIGPGVRDPAHSPGGLRESANIWGRSFLE